MTVETAKSLQRGNMVHHISKKNADGTPMRARVTSVKTWKTMPDRVRVGVKHGLRGFFTFDESEVSQIDRGYGS